jgi:hypothetical protein
MLLLVWVGWFDDDLFVIVHKMKEKRREKIERFIVL